MIKPHSGLFPTVHNSAYLRYLAGLVFQVSTRKQGVFCSLKLYRELTSLTVTIIPLPSLAWLIFYDRQYLIYPCGFEYSSPVRRRCPVSGSEYIRARAEESVRVAATALTVEDQTTFKMGRMQPDSIDEMFIAN
jgi:hypothetical protein